MIAVICLDNKNGYLFASRRQSRDRKLCEHLVSLFPDKKLFMNGYSAELFSKDVVICDDNFYKKAGENDVCFFENEGIDAIENAKALLVYRWNRDYPADKYLQLPSVAPKIVCEFEGNSHKMITLEEYSL